MRSCWLSFTWLVFGAVLTTGEPWVRVSERDPRYFELSDGRPYIPIGLNLIAPDGAFGTGETNGLRRMEDWLGKLTAQGGNFARVWLSSDFWEVEHRQAGEYDEAKVRRIDRLLALARKHGIRLKLTLEHFREISRTPRQRWANKWLHHVSQGGTATNMADWVGGRASREQFQSKLAWFAHRYAQDPTVFGWELWNEMNAVSGGDWEPWTREMLTELRRLFPDRLVMQSLGSFDSDGARRQYERLAHLADNDVHQVHRYLDLGASYEICHGPMDILAADAVRTLLNWTLVRPVLLAESGAVEPSHSGPFKLYAADTNGVILHDVLFAPFFSGAAGPGHAWHWGDYVDRNNLWWHFGRFAAAVEGVDPPAEGFRPARVPHDRLRNYALVGRRTILVWCRDSRNDWRSELQQGEPPEWVRDLVLDIPQDFGSAAGLRARAFDPWSGQWTAVAVTEGGVRLPAFRRSIVVRLERGG